VIDLDASLPSELVPLSWLLGVWEGTGVVNYTVGDSTQNHEFGQRLSFSHDGLPYLHLAARRRVDTAGDGDRLLEAGPSRGRRRPRTRHAPRHR
jgi:hypothetical protein